VDVPGAATDAALLTGPSVPAVGTSQGAPEPLLAPTSGLARKVSLGAASQTSEGGYLASEVPAREEPAFSGYCIRIPGYLGRRQVPERGVQLGAAGSAVVIAVAAWMASVGWWWPALNLVLVAVNVALLLLLTMSSERMGGLPGAAGAVAGAVAAITHLPDMLCGAGTEDSGPPPAMRLQLLGGVFARDPMGLLSQQVLMFQQAHEEDEVGIGLETRCLSLKGLQGAGRSEVLVLAFSWGGVG